MSPSILDYNLFAPLGEAQVQDTGEMGSAQSCRTTSFRARTSQLDQTRHIHDIHAMSCLCWSSDVSLHCGGPTFRTITGNHASCGRSTRTFSSFECINAG